MNSTTTSQGGPLAPDGSAAPHREQWAFDALVVSAFTRRPGPDDGGDPPSPTPQVDPDLVLGEEDERALDALGTDLAEQVFAEAVCSPATLRDVGASQPAFRDAAAPADEVGPGFPTAFGPYELLSRLGNGGMGVVYKARQMGLNRVVALKMLRPDPVRGSEELARFRTEAEAVARVRHPNVVQVYEVGEYLGQPYLSMEFMEGGSLARELAGGPLPPRAAAELVGSLARAVEATHRAGIVHRDLKPGNVLLAADGTPKLTDFGLAKLVDAEAEHTRTGAVIGTVSYMAPEQAEGRVREVGPLSDVWALGVILYECLTGRPPFRGSTATATLAQVRDQEPVPPRRLRGVCPRDLETVCLKCLEKDPKRRYPSAGALADDLHRFLDGRPVLVRPVSPVARALKWVCRHPTAAALSPLAATAALGVLLFCLSTARLTAERTKLHALLDRSNRELSQARAEIERLRGGPGAGDHASPAARIQQLRGWLAGGPGAPAGVARLLQEPTLRPDLERLNTLLERLAGPEAAPAADLASARYCLHDLRQNFRQLLTGPQARAGWSLREEMEVQGLFELVEAEVRRL